MVRDARESRVLNWLYIGRLLGLRRLWILSPCLVLWKLKSGWWSCAPLVSPRLVAGLPALDRVREVTWSHTVSELERAPRKPYNSMPQFTDEQTVAQRKNGRFPKPPIDWDQLPSLQFSDW